MSREKHFHPLAALHLLRKTLLVYLLPLVQVLFDRNWDALRAALRQDLVLLFLISAVCWAVYYGGRWQVDRDGEKIDNVDQALQRAVDNGVKNLVVQPTHLMHGAEYDELTAALEGYKDKFESIKIAEPLLGEVGADATVINADKAAVAEAITAEAVKDAGFDSLDAVKEDGTAFVFMGHGTSHTAKVSYSQMQTQMEQLGYDNVFIGTVEGEPEDTSCEAVIEKLKEAGYKKVILRPLMVVAGDHANNDMAGDDDDSWKSQFEASGAFDSIDTQIAGLGEIQAIQQLYVAHTQAAIDAE